MKTCLYLLMSALLLISSMACTKEVEKNNDAELAKLHEEIDRIQKENEDLNKALNTPITQDPATGEYSDAFLKNFCNLAKEDVSAVDVLPYVAVNATLEASYIEPLKSVAPQFTGCQFSKMLFYDYPFDLAEYKVDGGYAYVEAIYDTELKVTRFVPVFLPFQMSLTLEKIKTRDGVELTTYVAQRLDETSKKGALFLRTPYMLYGHYIHYIRMAFSYNKVFVLQANRGSHSSTGKFKWLDSVNVADGEDSVNWITQQGFSNGKVTAYGVSYDGYNALAVAGNNPQGLSSVISCSSPANAATDSFTSGKFVEKYIFSYISTDRKANSVLTGNILDPLLDVGTESGVRDQIDTLLLGQDLEEWNELSQAIDNQDDVYWTERSLYGVLAQTTVPIIHVGGLHRDQDGRDTILAFDHIQENSPYKDNHFLALHQFGHGCGDTHQLEVYKKMMALSDSNGSVDLSVEKKIHQYVKKQASYVSVNDKSELPLENKIVEFPENLILDDFYYADGDFEQLNIQTSFEVPMAEAFTLNGAVTVNMFVKATAPQVPVHVYMTIGKGEEIFESGWRTGFVTGDEINVVEEKNLTFPLMNAEIPADSVITVYVATVDGRVFYRQPEIKSQFTPSLDEPATLTVLSEGDHKTQIIMPVEI